MGNTGTRHGSFSQVIHNLVGNVKKTMVGYTFCSDLKADYINVKDIGRAWDLDQWWDHQKLRKIMQRCRSGAGRDTLPAWCVAGFKGKAQSSFLLLSLTRRVRWQQWGGGIIWGTLELT